MINFTSGRARALTEVGKEMVMEGIERDRWKKSLGRQGEDIAAGLLEQRGFQVLERNMRLSHKEVDIICRDGNDLRFVEVKTRREPVQGEAWEAVDMLKQRNMGKAAKAFLASKRCHDLGFRVNECHLDVLTVVWDESGETFVTEYFPDAFFLIYV